MRHGRKAPQSKSSSLLTVVSALYRGSHKPRSAIYKIDAGKGVVDLEFPWLARLRIDVTPVVQTKRRVTILPNLEDNNIAAQGVNRSGRNEHCVSRFRHRFDRNVQNSHQPPEMSET
jgi:hypothetical protein